VTLAVFAGLLIGKPLGITAATWIAVRLRLASLPDGAGWGALHGCAWLGGIGFTMSLFIATLAFGVTPRLDAAKAGILAASVCAGIAGALVLRNSLNRTPAADNGA
jgi:NhaA family Na+:H+ antiporter